MNYKRAHDLLDRMESWYSDDVHFIDALRELCALIDADKPAPRWFVGVALCGWGVYDRTLSKDSDSPYIAIDEMAADVIVNLLNDAEERTRDY